MFVMHLGVETDGKVAVETEPKWPRLQEAIEALDGESHSMVGLEANPQAHMTIGGGFNGWCVVGVLWTDGKFYRTIDPTAEEPLEPIELKVAGQTCVYLREMLLQQADVLKVAQPFSESGEFSGSVEWREQVMAELPPIA